MNSLPVLTVITLHGGTVLVSAHFSGGVLFGERLEGGTYSLMLIMIDVYKNRVIR